MGGNFITDGKYPSGRTKTKKKTGTKKNKRQAHSKLHTQKHSHSSLSCVSHSLPRLPFHLRQQPQLLVTNLLLHQQHQVTVQLPVQRLPIIFFISICQKKKHNMCSKHSPSHTGLISMILSATYTLLETMQTECRYMEQGKNLYRNILNHSGSPSRIQKC